MTKPKTPVPTDLLKSLSAAKPATQEASPRAGGPAAVAPAPKVRTSSRPVRSTAAPRSTNRGK